MRIYRFLIITGLLFISYLPVKGQPITSITGFSPMSGPVGTTVTITGTYFNITWTSTKIFFGAARTNIVLVSPTMMVVTVPPGATYAPITMVIMGFEGGAGRTVVSSSFFTPVFSPVLPDLNPNSFAVPVNFPAGQRPSGIGIADIDYDDKSEVLVSNSGGNSFSVYQNISVNGVISNNSLAQRIDFTTPENPGELIMCDINNSGKADVIVSSATTNTISVFRNTALTGIIDSNSFASRVDFSTGPSPMGIAAGDFNRDCKMDIVVANSGNNTLSVFMNVNTLSTLFTPASLSLPIYLETLESPVDVAIGDIDVDGKMDIVVINQVNGKLSVFHNSGNLGSITQASFDPRQDFDTLLTIPLSITLSDIDTDLRPDIIVSGLGGSIMVFRNTSTTGNINLSTPLSYEAGINSWHTSSGDLTGDGRTDLVTTSGIFNPLPGVLAFQNLHNTGNFTAGSMAPPVSFMAGNSPGRNAVADIDGDGRPEIIVANFDSSESGYTISIIHNNPPVPPSAIDVIMETSTFCPGMEAEISFDAEGVFNAGNIFTLEISDGSGNFISPQILDTAPGNLDNGTFSFIIPSSMADGAGYRLRIVSSSPAFTGEPGSSTMSIFRPVSGILSTDHDSICPGMVPSLFITESSGTIHWQSSLTNASFTEVPGNATAIFPDISQNSFFRVFTTIASCADTSEIVSIVRMELPVAGFSHTQNEGYVVNFTSTGPGSESFFWDFSLGSSTSENPSFTFPFDATYPVTLITENRCGSDTITEEVVVLKLLGTEEPATDEISFFPNPADETLMIVVNGSVNKELEYQLINSSGCLVRRESLSLTNGNKSSIDLSSLSPGIYSIIFSLEGKKISGRLVKD